MINAAVSCPRARPQPPPAPGSSHDGDTGLDAGTKPSRVWSGSKYIAPALNEHRDSIEWRNRCAVRKLLARKSYPADISRESPVAPRPAGRAPSNLQTRATSANNAGTSPKHQTTQNSKKWKSLSAVKQQKSSIPRKRRRSTHLSCQFPSIFGLLRRVLGL